MVIFLEFTNSQINHDKLWHFSLLDIILDVYIT